MFAIFSVLINFTLLIIIYFTYILFYPLIYYIYIYRVRTEIRKLLNISTVDMQQAILINENINMDAGLSCQNIRNSLIK
jgi:hypothetical protein